MRTLYDIIESAKDGQKPTHDECYFSMLVLVGLLNMASSDVRKLADEKKSAVIKRMYAEENHRRYKAALNTPPLAYLGDDVPGNPAYDEFRRLGKRLLNKAIERVEKSEG